MFGIGFGELAILALVALFVIGPERLPAAAAWTGQAIRRVKEVVAGAQESVQAEFGTELDQLRAPLAELQDLAAPMRTARSLRNPGSAALQHLLSDPVTRTRASSLTRER